MQTINTNQEIKAYNNNLKYSVNALINSNKLSQSQSDKNNFVNNFKNSNNNNNTSAKMSEIIRPIFTQRNPSFSAKVAANSHKLVNSKTSVSLIRNESFKKPSQNNLENSFNSFFSSSMKVIPNPIHLSCQKK